LNIGIVPSIKETYKNQFEYSVDLQLINFLKYCFVKLKVYIIYDTDFNMCNINFLIISGGNDIYSLSKKKKNLLRNRLDIEILKKAIKQKIPTLGICYGAQIISFFFKNKIFRKKGHVKKKNKIFIKDRNYLNKNFIEVKCFHNFSIKTKENIQQIGICKDQTTEFFKIKNKKIYGIMWHPERNRKIKKLNKKIVLKICS